MGRGQYIRTGRDPKKNTWLVFSPKTEDGHGVLASILKIFEANKVNLTHIESRSSQRLDGQYEFVVECDDNDSHRLPFVLEDIKKKADYINIVSREYKDNKGIAYKP